MITSIDAILRRLRGNHVALLIALDDHGSLRKAAQQVSLSQPATTKSLREIEAMFGTELFARSPRGIVPNELGRCVIRHARAVRSEIGALRDELAAIMRGGGGMLAIGAVMGSMPEWLAPILRALRQVQPDVSVEVWEDNSARLLSMLDQRLLDLVIGRPSISVHPEAYDFIPLEVEEVCLVVDGADPLASVQRLTLEALADNPWIVPQAALPMRSLLEQLFDDAEVPFPRYAIETSSTFATLSLLRASAGTVALMPLKVAQYFQAHGMMAVLPIRIERRGAPYGIATRRGATPTAPVQRFIELCKEKRDEQLRRNEL
ncbi:MULTISPECIES: LysR family transcriptional regulator [Caballeronia]|uniref:LysR family transcriptional regulator n=1 Tax=Caballeronia zhejiangensis TaxID=871203 RepID=A0A656QWF2_9BURK|nr:MULTISPECIES: LysR family transcriptional regulator [Caballeronia]KDR34118.1 LysR family transcriptional regulator [Caballeronia zhejiangensis]MCG7403168.1 LysR family transcriptional regulator [Caballeronia zhejiangensis]MCI1043992.1 LysR family transcriptional regulator [Caballeronia zhejiangensis]MDR5769963.1 LysR family transcriptional regulator [Caballeronia sp. LZ028]MDR5788322.1 LysR family transcriptional regulator [Caballeronia sp. LP003]